MTKGEFMRELEQLLSKIPPNEKNDALQYYNDYFADAGIENDMMIPASTGTPKEVADKIISETTSLKKEHSFPENTAYYQESHEYQKSTDNYRSDTTYYNGRKDNHTNSQRTDSYQIQQSDRSKMIVALIIIVGISSPIWMGLFFAMIGILISIFAALGGIMIGLGGAGIGLLVTAFFAETMSEGILLFGTGMLLIGVAVLCIIPLVMYCGQFLPWMFKEIVKLVKRLFEGVR